MIEIYYYSGTGFTLNAAKLFANELKEEVRLVPMLGAFNSGLTESEAENVGLFMPMHAGTIPLFCKKFLENFKFTRAKYIFSLITSGGASTKIHKDIDHLLKKQKKNLAAYQFVVTPNTFDPVFKVPLDEKTLRERDNIGQDIKNFAGVVSDRKHEIRLKYRNRIVENFVFPLVKLINHATDYFWLQNCFCANDKCIGCGKCETLCLSGKIKMKDGRPLWQKDVSCQYCLACLHFCPVEAVQISSKKDLPPGRIFCKDISTKELRAQKEYVREEV
ncbi:MAG: EFR1 family ferrodoxin [Spirochaetales bacterium]|nr:EFR1 family ferrodoxin [Spirochaetales bacterium]